MAVAVPKADRAALWIPRAGRAGPRRASEMNHGQPLPAAMQRPLRPCTCASRHPLPAVDAVYGSCAMLVTGVMPPKRMIQPSGYPGYSVYRPVRAQAAACLPSIHP